MYCIYTNTNFDDKNSTIQHIIPLSLGGVDEFCINIDSNKNSQMSSKIEGPLINEFTTFLYRMNREIKGQSNKQPEYKIRANINDNPVSIKWNKDIIDIFDPINKSHLNHSDIGDNPIHMRIKIDLYTRLRFLAKIALETGYFLFQEDFINHADCETLRKAIFEEINENTKLDLAIYDNFTPNEAVSDSNKGMFQLVKLLIEYINESCVILRYFKNRIIVDVGIMGKFLGSINFSVSDMDKIPVIDEFRQGQVLICQNKKLYCESLYNATLHLNKYYNFIDIENYESNAETEE